MTIELYKNSFVTLEEALNYFDERYDSNEWFDIEQSEKEKLLISASKKINTFDFVGTSLADGQLMVFPRDFAMPQDIKDAVCEEAISIIKRTKSVHNTNQEENISSISLGAGSVSYGSSSNSDETKLLASSTALYLVKKWIKKGYNTPC